jgi:hypothetical protein
MHVLMTAILLTVLMAFSSNLEPVKAQSADDSSQDNQSEQMSRKYGERLERFMGMDVRDFLEINRIVKHPTTAELQADMNEQNQLNFNNISVPDYIPHHKETLSTSAKVLRKYGAVNGELRGSFRLKDGNTAYYFLMKKSKATGNPSTPGVPNAVDITGTPVKSVSSVASAIAGRNTLSPYAVRTVPGYEIQPKYDSVPEGEYICETYLVAAPSGKFFFWSHKGDWPGCRDEHRNSTR